MSRPSRRAGERRLLLVEFLNRDRFSQYRSERFPFVRGWAETNGVPVRWLAFGFDPQLLPHGPFRMALPPAEEEALLAAVTAFRPTHVLTNEVLDDPLAALVRPLLPPGARLATLEQPPGPSFEWTDQVRFWFGLKPRFTVDERRDEGFLVDEVDPDYRCELVGPLAHAIRPFTFLVGGPHCLYARPVARNPRYAAVDLSAAPAAVGCTFCGEPPDRRYRYHTPPVPLALKQLRAALATLPPERAGGGFALWGAAAVLRLDDVFAAVLAEGLPPLSILVALRVDELRRLAQRLDALLPRLAAAGHALDLYNIGVENFSPAENERLNKGIDAEDVAAVHTLVTRWERDWPDTFRFTRHGGFGFILFTPWTTTDDLAINLEQARRLEIPNEAFFLTTRLQLMPGRPVTLLAAHDGLTADAAAAADLGGFGSGCIVDVSGYEVPWRFRDPEVAALYRVCLRLRPSPAVSEDEPLFRRVQALVAPLERARRSPLAIAALLLEAAAAEPRPTTADALLDRIAPRAAALTAGAAPGAPAPAPTAAEPPAVAAARATLAARARTALRRLESHPGDRLRGFRLAALTSAPTGPPWGELSLTLARDGETLRLSVLPAARLPEARWRGERFAVTHADATPADTPDRRHVIDLVHRGLERYVAACERAGAGPGPDAPEAPPPDAPEAPPPDAPEALR